MFLQLRRDFGSLKKSECFALLAPVALSFLSIAGNGILSLWAALSAALFAASWLVSIPLFAKADEKVRMR